MDPLGAERVDSHRRDHRRVDAAGQPEHDAGKAVLVDVVAQAHDTSAPVGLLKVRQCCLGAIDAAPNASRLLPGDDLNRLLELRHLEGERAVTVKAEGATVEDKLVLRAVLVDVDHRQAGLDDAGKRDLLAHVGLALPVGRAVGDDEHFRTGLGKAFADLFEPDVLADRQAQPQSAETDRARKRPDLEHAQLVEDAVVGQLDLVTQRLDLSAIEERHGVVALALMRPRRADDHAWAAIGGLGGESLDRFAACVLERRLQHQVLGWIAGDEQFGQNEQIGARRGRFRPRLPRLLEIAVNVADDRIELGDGELDRIGQGCCHNGRFSPARDAGQSAPTPRVAAGKPACVRGQPWRTVRGGRGCRRG